jgi:cold shock CspA family protein
VRALQNRGLRVDVLSFANTSSELKEEADNYICGFLVPELLPDPAEGRLRGLMHYVDEPKGFGFVTARTGLAPTEVRDDIFLHIRDFTRNGAAVSNAEFAALRTHGSVVEFAVEQQADGKSKARNATEVKWDEEFVRV